MLRITPVFAKIGFRKFSQPQFGDFFLPRKILLFQNSLDPNVDRKCAQAFISKQHYTVGYLCSHAGQCAQFLFKIGIGQIRPCLKIRFAPADESRSREQIFGAIAECAFAQIILRRPRDSLRWRKRVNHMISDLSFVTEASPKRQRNLTNMSDLFHRRTDERGQTFPFRLPNDSQTATKFSRCIHGRVVRE